MPATALPVYGAEHGHSRDRYACGRCGGLRSRLRALAADASGARLDPVGQLPLDHGVRDDAGFILRDDCRRLPNCCGIAVSARRGGSSFLLRPDSGVAQGSRFRRGAARRATSDTPALARDGAETLDAAEPWIRTQDGRRFFLFVQVDQRDADAAVTRLSRLLKARRL